MKNKYPITYALMSMYEKLGWYPSQYCSEDYKVVCYIVSKCYLIKEEKEYFDNGKYQTKYHILFPFEINMNGIWVRQEPQFNNSGICVNSMVVDQIFDSLELAISVKKQKNYEIIAEACDNLKHDNEYMKKAEEIKQKYKVQTAYYEQLGDIVRYIDLESDEQINSIDFKENTKTVLTYENGKHHLVKKKIYLK